MLRGARPQHKTIATKRSTLDNGVTVLDILGGDNYIGPGRSSLSGQSLTDIFPDMKEKILRWKPDIIGLWNFPKCIDAFTVDTQKKTLAFSGSQFRLPLLLRVLDSRVEPLPESEYSAPLRFQLADFTPQARFIWVDRCFKMARLWQPSLALSTNWCVSQGQPGGAQSVQPISTLVWQGQAAFAPGNIDAVRFQHNIASLKIPENEIRYQADSFIFNVSGAPDAVKQFSGISRPELWGRWSNAQLGKAVKIVYRARLPANRHFALSHPQRQLYA